MIRVWPIALPAHSTGGSARGCTSWSFPVRDGGRVLNVVSGSRAYIDTAEAEFRSGRVHQEDTILRRSLSLSYQEWCR